MRAHAVVLATLATVTLACANFVADEDALQLDGPAADNLLPPTLLTSSDHYFHHVSTAIADRLTLALSTQESSANGDLQVLSVEADGAVEVQHKVQEALVSAPFSLSSSGIAVSSGAADGKPKVAAVSVLAEEELWHHSLDLQDHTNGQWHAAALDSSEQHVHLVGDITDPDGARKWLLAKYRLSDGELISNSTSHTRSAGDSPFQAVVTHAGDVVFVRLGDGGEAQLHAFNDAADTLTQMTSITEDGWGMWVRGVAVHGNKVCVAGYRDEDAWVGCVDATSPQPNAPLVHEARLRFDDDEGGYDEFDRIVFAPDGRSVVVSASFSDDEHIGLASVDLHTGQARWIMRAESAGGEGQGVALDKRGWAYLTVVEWEGHKSSVIRVRDPALRAASITVAEQLANRTAITGEAFTFTVPATLFAVDAPTPDLNITGSVTILHRAGDGGEAGIAVSAGAPGEARVAGTCTLAAGSGLHVVLTAQHETGVEQSTTFSITVVKGKSKVPVWVPIVAVLGGVALCAAVTCCVLYFRRTAAASAAAAQVAEPATKPSSMEMTAVGVPTPAAPAANPAVDQV